MVIGVGFVPLAARRRRRHLSAAGSVSLLVWGPAAAAAAVVVFVGFIGPSPAVPGPVDVSSLGRLAGLLALNPI